MALSLYNTKTDTKIVLLSDAVYLIYNLNETDYGDIYALEEDLDKRIDQCPAWIHSLNYEDFIDLIMSDGMDIINL